MKKLKVYSNIYKPSPMSQNSKVCLEDALLFLFLNTLRYLVYDFEESRASSKQTFEFGDICDGSCVEMGAKQACKSSPDLVEKMLKKIFFGDFFPNELWYYSHVLLHFGRCKHRSF